MDGWQIALAIGAAIAAALSWREPRGIAWIIAGAASFIATDSYEAAGWPYHAIVTGFFDAGVCLLIYFFAAYRWEMWLYRIFQTSVFVSLLRASGFIDSHYAYIVALEVCNWAALLVIGGTAIGERVDARMALHRPARGRFRRAVATLRQARRSPPFTKVP